ncbi:MAG: ferritin family protein [Desulfobacterales bacterium]|jgi:rubrerythrin
MSQSKPLDILKSAILLEQRGNAFYSKVAEEAKSPAVQQFFSMMAEEERRHIKVLSDQAASVQKTGRFAPGVFQAESSQIASSVLSQELKEQIAAAGFEAAAVAAAMAMEERSIRLYADRAEESGDPEEQRLYRWLADWESEHLHFLAGIDREITEKIWFDNSYWPF